MPTQAAEAATPSAFVYPKEAFDAATLGCCEAGAYLCPHGLHIRDVANVWRFGAWPGALFRNVELVNLGSLGCAWIALRFDGRPTSRGEAVPAGLFVVRYDVANRVKRSVGHGWAVVCQRDCVTLDSEGRRVEAPISARVRRTALRTAGL